MEHTAHLYELKSWVTLCGDETGKFLGKPVVGDTVVMCQECHTISLRRLVTNDDQPFETITVPEGFYLATLRRWTYDRKHEYYDAQMSHPGNVDSVMRSNVNYEKGYQ